MKHNYFVCSYGGSGSKMLSAYLANFGNVFHMHSRSPPENLTKAGTSFIEMKNLYKEWFTDSLIHKDELKNYTVIYIYKNPVNAIFSRFDNPDHLRHIETKTTTTIENVINTQKDLYGIEEFFDNYTVKKTNYDIVCIKYEDFFDNIEEINKVLNIENNPKLYPKRRESKYEKKEKYRSKLEKVYEKLITRMKNHDPVFINKAKNNERPETSVSPWLN